MLMDVYNVLMWLHFLVKVFSRPRTVGAVVEKTVWPQKTTKQTTAQDENTRNDLPM